jgi:hypothetical protein
MPYNKLFINLACSVYVQRKIGLRSPCRNIALRARSVQKRPRSDIFLYRPHACSVNMKLIKYMKNCHSLKLLNVCFFVLFLLEIVYFINLLSLWLFHFLNHSESLNSQWNLHCISFFCTVFHFLALYFKKIALLII